MAGGTVPGRHIRRAGLAGLRPVFLAALIMLVVQYGLGTILNLYVAVPASDAHAGLLREIASGPLMLTLHALLGLALIGTAIVLLVRAVRAGDRVTALLAAGGLTAICGAFGAGEIFVRNGQQSASLAMALLTGMALLCYIVALARVSAGRPTRQTRAIAPSRPGPAGRGLARGATTVTSAGPDLVVHAGVRLVIQERPDLDRPDASGGVP